MLRVDHQISIGGSTYRSADRSRLVDLRVSAALGIPVNHCRLSFSPPEELSAAAGDTLTVALGYDEDLATVFTGTVEAVDWRLDRLTIHGTGSFQQLVSARFNAVYQQAKAGDIVSDLIGKLGLSQGTVDPGPEFPSYALGDDQSAYDHLQRLAQRSGFDFYADAEDQVMFTGYEAADGSTFRYGVNILEMTAETPLARVSGVEVFGESPASLGQGSEAASWLTKKEVKGKAGDTSGAVRRIVDPTLRTADAASEAASAALAAMSVKRRGLLRVLGDAGVKLGGTIKASGLPESTRNGTFKVTGVLQTLTRSQGFRTAIHWEEP